LQKSSIKDTILKKETCNFKELDNRSHPILRTVYTYVYIYEILWTHTCIYVYITYTYTYISIYIYTHVRTFRECGPRMDHLYIQMNMCICMYIYIHVNIHIHIHIHICIGSAAREWIRAAAPERPWLLSARIWQQQTRSWGVYT